MKKSNFLWMFLGTGSGAIMTMLMNIVLQRGLTKEEYGTFVIGITLINILSVIVGFGVPDFIVKAFAVEGRAGYRWLNACKRLFSFSFALVIIIILGIVLSGIYDLTTNEFILLLIPNIILQGIYSVNNSIYQIEENFSRIALSNFLIYFVRFFSAVITVLTWADIITLGWFLAAMSIFAAIPYLLNVRRLFTKTIKVPILADAEIPIDQNLKETFNQTYPFGLISIFYFIYYQSNVIILSLFEGKTDVGEYQAAFAIISLAFMFPDLIFRRIYYTRIHTWATHDPKRLLDFNKKSTMVLMAIGIFAVIFIFLTGKWLILFTAGEKYIDSIMYLKLLSIAILFKFGTAISGVILSTQHMVYKMMRINGMIAVINVILNLILIPIFGVTGAIIATLLCELILGTSVVIVARRYIATLITQENVLHQQNK